MQDFWDVKVIEIDAIHLYMYKNEQNLVNFPVRITFVIFILEMKKKVKVKVKVIFL